MTDLRKLLSDATPGPWHIMHPILWIMADEEMQVADIRGWGRLTAPPTGGLGLSYEAAREIQEANARRRPPHQPVVT